MTKFKVGDKVVLNKDFPPLNLYKGDKGMVEALAGNMREEGHEECYVVFFKTRKNNKSSRWISHKWLDMSGPKLPPKKDKGMLRILLDNKERENVR